MSAARSADLRKRKAELDIALAEENGECRRARRKVNYEAKRDAKAWLLSPALKHTVLVIYALADYTAEPAAKFLLNSGRKRHWPEKTEEELVAIVESHFLEVDSAELADLSDINDPSDAAAMNAALVYVEQWRLAKWTARQNLEVGVAPSTESVLQRLEEQRVQLPEAVRPRAIGTAAEPRARVWAGALRHRWGGKHARIRVRDDIPVAELRDKVCQKSLAGGHTQIRFSQRKADPNLVSETDPESGVRELENCDKRGTPNEIPEPKADPILGSENDPDSGVRKRPQFRGRSTLY